jgi:hypothetical protein
MLDHYTDGGLSWALIPKEGEPPSSQHVDLRQAPYDVVVANILARPLVELVSTLTQLTRPGGHIVLAGLLNEQVGARQTATRAPSARKGGTSRMSGHLFRAGGRRTRGVQE